LKFLITKKTWTTTGGKGGKETSFLSIEE